MLDAELARLLHDRFDITATEFAAALRSLPLTRPWAATLPAEQARLLDAAEFNEDREAFAVTTIEAAGSAAHLAATAFTAEEVSTGLGVSASRVRQKRLAGELWAVPDGRTWAFPKLQFEISKKGVLTRQVRGLDQVLKALPAGLHPVVIAGFLQTPQPALFQGHPTTPIDWLRQGGDIDAAVTAAAAVDWYTS